MPPGVRPRNVALMVISTAVVFAFVAFVGGFIVMAGLASIGVPIERIRVDLLIVITLIGGFIGFQSGWNVIQEVIRDKTSHDHVS